ncbi:MAG: AtpZ/AtpI family protein [Proteobacteria bacterium]|nr:AtpZ/AtpI family protein [Pseudomonadota bacterium]
MKKPKIVNIPMPMKNKSLTEEEILNEKIASFRQKPRLFLQTPSQKLGQKQAVSFFRVGSEFVSAIIASVLLGLGIDALFNIQPYGIIGFFVIGSIAGFLNIFRILRQMHRIQKDDVKTEI